MTQETKSNIVQVDFPEDIYMAFSKITMRNGTETAEEIKAKVNNFIISCAVIGGDYILTDDLVRFENNLFHNCDMIKNPDRRAKAYNETIECVKMQSQIGENFRKNIKWQERTTDGDPASYCIVDYYTKDREILSNQIPVITPDGRESAPDATN